VLLVFPADVHCEQFHRVGHVSDAHQPECCEGKAEIGAAAAATSRPMTISPGAASAANLAAAFTVVP
jgi:hypothetical protein